MADQLVLAANTDRVLGSRSTRRLRRTGQIPGVVYGLASAPTPVSVNYRDTRNVLSTDAGLNALLHLEVNGESQLVLVKDVQRHPVRDEVIHIDFIRVDPDEEVSVEVPIVLIGEARQVTQEDGMVDQIMFSIEVFSKPTAIPNEFELDISELTIGDAIHVSDVPMPAGVRTEEDPEDPIAIAMVTRSTLEALREEEEAEAEEEAAEAAEAAEGESEEAASDGDDD